MTIYHFGTSVDTSVLVEQVPSTPPGDASPTAAPLRPGRGQHLRVRNPAFGTDLPDIVTDDYGYWDYTTEDIPVIWVSSDNFNTKVSVRATEAMDAAATTGVDVTTALTTAKDAKDVANQALVLASQAGTGNVESVNGKLGSVILTATDVQARPLGAAIAATEVAGLSPVATTGKYTDLTSTPPVGIPLTDKGTPNGVPALDGAAKVKLVNMPRFAMPHDDPNTRPTTDLNIAVWWYTATPPSAATGPFDTWINTSA